MELKFDLKLIFHMVEFNCVLFVFFVFLEVSVEIIDSDDDFLSIFELNSKQHDLELLVNEDPR